MTIHIAYQNTSSLNPSPRNPRRHSKSQVKQVARSIEQFGFLLPVLVTDDATIICGHCKVEAAKALGMEQVPTIAASHLTETQIRAFAIADNKLALNAEWDAEALAIELQSLLDVNFDIELTGFSIPEIDVIIDGASDADPASSNKAVDDIPALAGPAVTRRGDLWLLGRHRLLCGDSQLASSFIALMAGDQADLVFTDPPFNVPIDRNVCGLGSVTHREFDFASGEMSPAEFTSFLSTTLGNIASVMRDGAIAYVCMDWRHIGELLEAGRNAFSEFKNLIVWNKNNAGMGTFYRSKHELIFVFKQGLSQHINNFELGGQGRYRTNVWDYAGISSFGTDRDAELAMHPTVKPVDLIADAILDCSRRGGIVLDAFGGSGSTMIAAHKTGRVARLIEYDELYCDTIIHRWQKLTGKCATLLETGRTFEDTAEDRFGKHNS